MYRTGGPRMPQIGGGHIDIRSIIGSIVNIVKSKAANQCPGAVDGTVLRMHYRWTFFLMIGNFFIVYYQWYHRDVITCVSHFNADTQVRMDYMNICLSYPYLLNENKERRYLLFYRWIHWSFLLFAGVYYIPRKISKNVENVNLLKLFNEIAVLNTRYEAQKQVVDKIVHYFQCHLRTHNGIYWKYLGLNIVALGIDIAAFNYMDFLLQWRFRGYVYLAYPFHRDPEHFTDYMSQTFPPFASCELDKGKQLVAMRTEVLGCHLTMMEVYEKVFFGLWIWMIILTAVTVAYILALFLYMTFPSWHKNLLKTEKPYYNKERVTELSKAATDHFRFGDIYVLYRIKFLISHATFVEVLKKLQNEKTWAESNPCFPEDITVIGPKKQQQPRPDCTPANVRNRRHGDVGQPMNENELKQLLIGSNRPVQLQPSAPALRDHIRGDQGLSVC